MNCTNGHEMRESQRFCQTCGAPVADTPVTDTAVAERVAPVIAVAPSPKTRRRIPLWAAIVSALVAFMIGAAAGGSGNATNTAAIETPTEIVRTVETTVTVTAQPAAPAAKPKPAAPKRWVAVAQLGGSTNKRSALFALTGGQARLRWTVRGDSYAGANIYVMAEGDSLEASGGFPEASPDGAGSDSTMLVKDAGRYYLDVKSANATWTIWVEEYR